MQGHWQPLLPKGAAVTHLPRCFRDVTYRLFLLHRLTLVCAALLWGGMGCASWISDAALPWDAAPLAWGAGALALVALHNVLFPAGQADILSGSIAGAVTLPLQALARPLGHIEVQLALALLFWFVLTLGVVRLIAATLGIGRKTRAQTRIMDMPVAVSKLREVIFVRSDMQRGGEKFGAVGENGFFPVNFGLIFPDPQTFELPANGATQDKPDCFIHILGEDTFSQASQWVIADGAGQMTDRGTVVRYVLTPLGDDHCRLEVTERHDAMDYLTMVSGWLAQQERDYYRDRLDMALGRATPAVRRLPHVTLLMLIARFFVRSEFTAPDGRPLG